MASRPLELSKDDVNVVYGGGTNTVQLIANDTFQPIIVWKVPRQVIWTLIKNPKVRMKLKDSSGNELPAQTELMISIQKPAQRLPQEIGTVKLYATYRALDLAQQLDSDNDVSVRFNLKNAGSFPEESKLMVLAKVPTDVTLDWSKSDIFVGEAGRTDLVETDI